MIEKTMPALYVKLPLLKLSILALMLSSGLHAEDFLEDATLLVAPGEDPASGLVALPGIAIVTIKAKQDYLSNVTYIPVDGTVLTDFKDRSGPCDNNSAWTTWRWDIAAPITNSDVSAITKGLVVRCSGSGGAPPEFKGRIVHVDLDADTDNTSDPLTAQKRPDVTDEEDAAEWPVGADADKKPGLVLIVNHGFEEDGYGDGSSPIEDFKKDGVKTDDLDLSQSVLKITGGRHGNLKLTYDDTKLKVYRDTGSSAAELWKPGQSIPLDPGTYHLLFEGLAAGVAPIIADFYPDQGTGRPAEDKIKVTVVDLQLQVDRNRDEAVTGMGSDLTRTDDPLVFWYNNNNDGENTARVPGRSNYERKIFTGFERGDRQQGVRNFTLRRDLEDFQRMVSHADGPGLANAIREDRMHLAVGFMPSPARTEKLRVALWQNPDANATMNYLKNVTAADVFCKETKLVIRTEAADWNPIDKKRLFFPGGDVVRGSYLWDADGDGARSDTPESETTKSPGKGQLGLLLWDKSKKILAVNRHLDLVVGDFRYFFQHFSAGDKRSTILDLYDPAVESLLTVDSGPDLQSNGDVDLTLSNSIAQKSKLIGTDQLFLFVHGYRMQTWERRAFAECAFKRLYWQGWNGRFAFFSWPTEYVGDGTLPQAVDPQNYDRSEFQARRSGALTLPIVLSSISAQYGIDNVTVMAHSMGNVVVSEALRLQSAPVARTYFAMQSAEASGAYTRNAAPPLVPNNVVSNAAYDSNYTPDLFGFSAPRPIRSLVNWAEWDQEYRTGGGDDPERTGPTAWESYRLSHPVDGDPYHIAIIDRNVVPRRFAYFNGSDPATSAAWNYTQLARPDFGFSYTPLLVEPRPPNASLGDFASYQDFFVIDTSSRMGRRYARTPPFILLPTDPSPNSRDRLLPWSPNATDPNGLTARAAILAFACKSWTQAVGTINTEDPNLPGGPLGIFNQTIDARDEFKIAGGELDHSAFFVYSIQRMWKGWASIKARAGGN